MRTFFLWLRYSLLWLLSALLFFVLDGYFFFLVFVLITIIPWGSFFMMRVFSKRIQLKIQYKQNKLQIQYTSNNVLPLAIMKLRVHHKNIFYGESKFQDVRLICEPKAKIYAPFRTEKSGKYECDIHACVLYDLLGLFHKTIRVSQQTTQIIYPQPSFDYIKTRNTQDDESEVFYKQQQPGTNYELREYHPQDSLRYVHHKMSYKLSKLMIKQFEPEEHEHYSVFLDFSGNEEQCEEVLSLFYGYALDCLQSHSTLDAVWNDLQGVNTMHIASEDDIKECLETILSSPRTNRTCDQYQEDQVDAILSFAGLITLHERG